MGTGARTGATGATGSTGAVTTSSVCQPGARDSYPCGFVAQPASATASRHNSQAYWLIPRGVLPSPHKPREHPTSNIQRPTSIGWAKGSPGVFDVGCGMLDVPLFPLKRPKDARSSRWSPPSPAGPGPQAEACPDSNTRALCECAVFTQAVSAAAPGNPLAQSAARGHSLPVYDSTIRCP